MALTYTIEPASHFDLGQLANLVTDSFKGYAHPVFESESRLARLIRIQNIDLHLSAVVCAADGDLAGIGFLGLRPSRAWISAFGITTPHRRQGLATRLLDHLCKNATTNGASEIRLEVLVQNDVARHLYASNGFEVRHQLVSFERHPQRVQWASPRLKVARVSVDEASYAASSLDHAPRCWQRELPALLTGSAAGYLVTNGTAVVGAATFAEREALVSLHHVCAVAESAFDVATAVVAALSPGPYGRYITILNESDQGPLIRPLLACGFLETMRQFELVKPYPR